MDNNHYCDRCYYQDKGASAYCGQCRYDESTGFSHWKVMNTMFDVVQKPKHYMLMDNLEVRDVLAALVAKIKASDKVPNSTLFESDYVQFMQYVMRFMDKNGKEDLEKGLWFLQKMINAYD